jgi:hypothetical protein
MTILGWSAFDGVTLAARATLHSVRAGRVNAP